MKSQEWLPEKANLDRRSRLPEIALFNRKSNTNSGHQASDRNDKTANLISLSKKWVINMNTNQRSEAARAFSGLRLMIGVATFAALAGCATQRSETTTSFAPVYGQEAPASKVDVSTDRSDTAPPQTTGLPVSVTTSPASSSAADSPRSTQSEIGTGFFFDSDLGQDTSAPVRQGDVVLNFVDSDIREVARAVFEDILSVNYVIDPQVSGKVSLATSQPVRTRDVLPLMESAFHLSGTAIVLKNGVYYVVRESEALRLGAPMTYDASSSQIPGYSVKVVQLHYANAAEIAKLVEPLAPKNAIVNVDEARNVLILSGDSATIARLNATIASFDVDWMAGMSFALVPVDSPDLASLTSSLQQVFSLGSETADTSMKFLPLERLQSVLIVTREPKMLERAESWVKRLDDQQTRSGRQLWVYDVQFGRAPELAAMLSSVFGGNVVSQSNTNNRSIVAPGETMATIQSGASIEDFIADPSAEFSPSDNSAYSTGYTSGQIANKNDGFRIFPYETSNSLAIFATESEYRIVESALNRIDVRPMQVMLEATIVDVTLNNDLRYGVQWFLESGEFNVGLTQSKSSLSSTGATLPGFAVTFQGDKANAAISALESVTDVQILSRPRLLVSNNQQASLQIGDQVPVVTRTSTSTIDPAAPIVADVELRDTGVILSVTPRINANGLVSLDIEQEVSDVAPTTSSGIDSPTIRQRRLQTNVTVDSGATIALGGLIRDDATTTRSGIPVLSDVPILGQLFRTTNKTRRRGELVVLITPKVVQAPEDIDAVTSELLSQISELGL
ncbi:type II secretion system secretin GspD [Hyphomonas sp.]|uniref:type II secretion system secretin GspD n=1 Tax=Hyphomonas sp. TaxID=87 RepID=UPI003527BE42